MNTSSSSDIRRLPGYLRPATRDAGSASAAPAPHDEAASASAIETADPADRAAFGDFLRHARERRQLTLQQIANDTKIASRHLNALEQGNVKSLPGGMYRRAMLRAYADSVGLDKEAALEHFERTFEPQTRAATPAPRTHVDSPARLHADSPARPARHVRTRDTRLLLGIVVLSATAVVALVTGDPREQASAVAAVQAVAPSAQAPALAPTLESSNPTSAAEPPIVQAAMPAPTPSAAPARALAQTITPPSDAAALSTIGSPEPQALVPAAARATAGEIAIVTEPAGARVTINGTGWGESPVTVRHLPFGSKRVRVTLDGYASQERVIAVAPGSPSATMRVTLEPRD